MQINERQYITYEEAVTLFNSGYAVWYELEELTQEDIDSDEIGEYEGYTAGTWLSTCKSKDMGFEVEDLEDDVRYFIDND